MSKIQRYAGGLIGEDYVDLIEDGEKLMEIQNYGN